ncbi:hypothetical protein BB559_003646 [Furculomyces boomerangus]|nr:hypothetical protein BB559_003646 [Furculomyces boomerangus]
MGLSNAAVTPGRTAVAKLQGEVSGIVGFSEIIDTDGEPAFFVGVDLSRPNENRTPLFVTVDLKGLAPDTEYAYSINTGTVSGDNCSNTGQVFDPLQRVTDIKTYNCDKFHVFETCALGDLSLINRQATGGGNLGTFSDTFVVNYLSFDAPGGRNIIGRNIAIAFSNGTIVSCGNIALSQQENTPK